MKRILLILVLLTGINYATTYGPTLIKKCSSCSGLIQENTLNSGNTFGAKYWTDGKMEAPMLPDSLWLVKCPHCNSLVWIDELEKVGSKKFSRDKEIKRYIAPEFEDYLIALKQVSLTDKKEVYLRIRAWWAGNDKRRDNKRKEFPMTEAEKENLKAFFKSFSVEKHRIRMAEIQRELGEFVKAKKILDSSSVEKQSEAEILIRELIKQGNPHVLEIKYKKN